MKKENTPLNKAKFFSLYFDQFIMKKKGNRGVSTERAHGIGYMSDIFKKTWLELTPLSQITDEDAIEVAKAVEPYFTFGDADIKINRSKYGVQVVRNDYKFSIGKKLDRLGLGFTLSINKLPQRMVVYDAKVFLDTLIDKGYYVGDGTEIEYGWVKLKEAK